MGWRVRDPELALKSAIERGARRAEQAEYRNKKGDRVPAVYGIGDSLIYFFPENARKSFYEAAGFRDLPHVDRVQPLGFETIDHLTNNVEK